MRWPALIGCGVKFVLPMQQASGKVPTASRSARVELLGGLPFTAYLQLAQACCRFDQGFVFFGKAKAHHALIKTIAIKGR